MQFKSDVKYYLDGVVKIMLVADEVYKFFGHEAVVTSLMDGNHMATSKHYSGEAVDLRTNFFRDQEEKEDVVRALRAELGRDYDVVLESTHIHVEFDPKDV